MPYRLLLPGLLALVLQTPNARAAAPEPTPTPIPGVPVIVDGTIFALTCLLREPAEEPQEPADLADCSRASLANGASLAIRESGSGRILGISAESPASDPAGMAREFIAEDVRIRGRLYRRAEFTILVPETIQGLPAQTPKVIVR